MTSRVRILCAAMFSAAAPGTVLAQDAPQRLVQVTGTGVVRTVPDVATLEFWMRGEGATPDAATAALAARQKAVAGGLAGLLGPDTEIATGEVTAIEVRDRQCDDARGYGSKPRLSEGECAVIGHVVTMRASVRTKAVEKAGTAAGLAARLGASDARLTGFVLSDPQAAMRRATAAAIADARVRAEAAATGAGVRLGALMTVRDGSGFQPEGELVVTAARVAAPAPPAPPAPVALDVRPRPVETRAQVTVTYAIAP